MRDVYIKSGGAGQSAHRRGTERTGDHAIEDVGARHARCGRLAVGDAHFALRSVSSAFNVESVSSD